MASGMSASATTIPASKSLRTLESQSWRRELKDMDKFKLARRTPLNPSIITP